MPLGDNNLSAKLSASGYIAYYFKDAAKLSQNWHI
jgi:hypothetical protein